MNALVVNLQWPRIPVLYSVQQAVMACLVLPTVLSRFSKCHKITADTTNWHSKHGRQRTDDTALTLRTWTTNISAHRLYTRSVKSKISYSIATGTVPTAWKTSTIAPVSKCGANTLDFANYRPISLLSICNKILERHISQLLTPFLTTIDTISDIFLPIVQ